MCEIGVGIPWCWWVGPKDRGALDKPSKRPPGGGAEEQNLLQAKKRRGSLARNSCSGSKVSEAICENQTIFGFCTLYTHPYKPRSVKMLEGSKCRST